LKPWRKDMCAFPGRWRICRPHGRRTRPLCRSAQSQAGRWSASTRARSSSSAEVRQPIPAEPGQLERYDHEYRRNGTSISFVWHRRASALAQGQGHSAAGGQKITPSAARTGRCPLSRCHCIRVVQDNLSTIRPAPSTRHSRPPKPAEFCAASSSTTPPSNASWLNMVEIEIGVLRGQCLDRRIERPKRLLSEIAAWEKQRNAAGPASNGCSQPKRPAPKWAAPIPSHPKSHNHCAEGTSAKYAIHRYL